MASETRLNQIVKGTPPANLHTPPPEPLPLTQSVQQSSSHPTTSKYTPTDSHLSNLPSSPPQIYLNLLVLESSLRSQYLHLLSRRRLNTFFLLLLALWNSFFIYALFLRPREDGTGRGGSVYWFVETSEKIALLGGGVTVLLVRATGQWERGIRWPRRWLGTTNRGLRGFNLRVVVVKGKWWREMAGRMAFLLPYGLWREAGGSDWHLIEHEQGGIIEEDLAPGGNHIMLLLLPKSFSPEFRENWEEYRADYWEKENERRSMLRRRVALQRRARAKEAGGWPWWTGLWRLAPRHNPHHGRKGQDADKHGPHHGKAGEKDSMLGPKNSRRRSLMRSESSHSRHSSRSSTPHLQSEYDGTVEGQRARRGSSSSVRRKKRIDSLAAGGSGGVPGSGTASHRSSMILSPLTLVDGDVGGGGGGEGGGEERKRSGKGSRPSTPAGDVGSFHAR